MMNIEINDVRVANLVRDAVDAKIVDMKSLLHTEVTSSGNTTAGIGDMDMVTITELVTDINALGEVSNQINVKIQFQTPTEQEDDYMDKIVINRCQGEGQGSCKRCSDNGKWSRHWMCFLYKIEGLNGNYCSECVKAIKDERNIK